VWNVSQGIDLVSRDGQEGTMDYVRQVAAQPQNMCLAIALVGIAVLTIALVLLVT
jgi:hypothetical protein